MKRSKKQYIETVELRATARSPKSAMNAHSLIGAVRKCKNEIVAKYKRDKEAKDFYKVVSATRSNPKNEYLKKLNTKILSRSSVKPMEEAYEQYSRGNKGEPKFQKRNHATKSFTSTDQSFTIRQAGEKIEIIFGAGIGMGKEKIKFTLFNKNMQEKYKIEKCFEATIMKRPKGFVCRLSFEIEEQDVVKGIQNGEWCSLDVNADFHVAIFSSGEIKFFKKPKVLDDLFEERKRLQTYIDTKISSEKWKPGSKRHDLHKYKVSLIHAKEAEIRKTYNHQVSRYIADRAEFVFVEKLNIAKMSKSKKGTVEKPGVGVKAHSTMTRKFIQHNSPGDLIARLKMKARIVVQVNPKDTSRTCPDCLGVNKESREKQPWYVCDNTKECGFEGDADLVGSYNIAHKAIKAIPFIKNIASLDLEEIKSKGYGLLGLKLPSKRDKELDKKYRNRCIHFIEKEVSEKNDSKSLLRMLEIDLTPPKFEETFTRKNYREVA